MTMMRMMTLPLLLVLLVGVCTLQTSAFTSPVRKSCFVSHTTTATRTAASASASAVAVAVAVALSSTQRDDDYDDFASEDKDGIGSDYKGDIDWDGEWKKVVADQKGTSSSSRPGKEFYKSEAEIAAIRAANKAQEKVYEVASQAPSMPAWSSLQKDPKFWIGALLVISVGISLVSAVGQGGGPPMDAGGDSYYI